MGLFSKKREDVEDATPHPSPAATPSPEGEGVEERSSDARPSSDGCDPSSEGCVPSSTASGPPSPEGEGTNRLLPREKLSAELTDEGVEDEADVLQPTLEQMVLSSFDELCDIAPTLTAAELLGSEDIASIGARLRRGYSLRDAYLLSQIKLHGSNGCSHLKKTSNTHRASTHLPDDVLAAYSIFMPKASRAEIQKNYMEYLARTGKG